MAFFNKDRPYAYEQRELEEKLRMHQMDLRTGKDLDADAKAGESNRSSHFAELNSPTKDDELLGRELHRTSMFDGESTKELSLR